MQFICTVAHKRKIRLAKSDDIPKNPDAPSLAKSQACTDFHSTHRDSMFRLRVKRDDIDFPARCAGKETNRPRDWILQINVHAMRAI